ncbi:MAG: site-2 protease family protein [Eggerthellaceae bacterium]|nr:site-2 protease family protein [Eggerthellaceae bacterium]
MNSNLLYIIVSIAALAPAIVLHEVAHGVMAAFLGDPTAKSKGRLSLNPLRHIDPFGTVIMPFLLVLSGLPVFAYAKPVPYNPRYFKNVRVGEALVGLAGPAANLILALGASLIAWFFYEPVKHMEITGWISAIGVGIFWIFLPQFILINLYLMFFNLIPIPPLDGSSIISIFLNDKALMTYYRIQQYALPALMLLILVVPYVFHINPISAYLDATAGTLAHVIAPFWR